MDDLVYKVLILDDEEGIRISLTDFFEDEGFCVSCVSSSEEALDVLADKKIDVGVIDIRLPTMTGIDFILKAHHIQPDMKYVIYTGSSDFVLPLDLYEIGIRPNDVFNKPIEDMSLISNAVRQLLSKD